MEAAVATTHTHHTNLLISTHQAISQKVICSVQQGSIFGPLTFQAAIGLHFGYGKRKGDDH